MIISKHEIETLKDQIEAIKADFDKRYMHSHLYASYSRVSLQRQWRMMNEQIKPLVTKLMNYEYEGRRAEIASDIQLYQQMKRRKRKDTAA